MATNLPQLVSTSTPTTGDCGTVTIELIQELSADLTAETTERTVVLPPSPYATQVTARATVVSHAAIGLRSAAYVGAVRRTRIRKIIQLTGDLGSNAARSDFHSYTFPVFDEIRSLLQFLGDREDLEGNTCAILRHIRNTLMDGGWNRYRDPGVREVAVAILQKLASVETVEPEDAALAFREMHAAGMSPSLPVTLDDAPEEGEQREEEISS
ncbi:MAG: hypothetical protein NTU53_12570 [Planctomycetota bacterium]|nr:hypothetical protein [Planctomycetota bacterium]